MKFTTSVFGSFIELCDMCMDLCDVVFWRPVIRIAYYNLPRGRYLWKKTFSCCNDDNKRIDSCIDLPEQHFLWIIKRFNKSIRRWITVIWILLCWNELSSQNCRSTYFIEDSPTLVNLVKWAENVFSSRFNSLVLVYWIFSLFYERINMINLGSISESFNELSLQESIWQMKHVSLLLHSTSE